MTTKNNPISIGGAVSSALRCVRADVKQFCAVLAVALLAAASAAGAGETRPEAKAVTSAPAPQVKLLEAGAGPRKKLRLHPKPGDKQTVDMTFKIAMDIQTGDSASQAMKMPAMKMTTDVTIKGVSSDGNITYEMVMTDVSVADDTNATPEVVEGMKSSLAGLKGLSGAGVMSDRGINQGIEMKAPTNASPQLVQALEQAKETFSTMTAPLPEEAVGPGARWEFKQPIKSQGMTIDQTSASQLVSFDGERVSTKNTILQSASNQKIQNPAMEGLQLNLTKMAGNGKGNTTVDLRKLLPVKATADVHTEFSMEMEMGGQKTTMTTKMDMTIGIESRGSVPES